MLFHTFENDKNAENHGSGSFFHENCSKINLPEVLLPQPPCGHRGRAEPHAAGDEGALVSGHAVLVECDLNLVAH